MGTGSKAADEAYWTRVFFEDPGEIRLPISRRLGRRLSPLLHRSRLRLRRWLR